MNTLVRTYQLAKILVVSQLRSSRSESGKSRIWDRPSFILAANVLALSVSSVATLGILLLSQVSYGSLIETLFKQVLAFVPMFVLAMVLLAGMMFELNTSSRFASSDLVNWLPISRGEYVAASASSVSYIYSPYLCIAAGITLALSMQTNLFFLWTASFVLSIVSLVTGGFLIEILRASINRVYSVMSKKTGRAVLIVRLALIVVLLAAFQAAFNPNFLLSIMGGVIGTLDTVFFIPLFWPSLTIIALATGNIGMSIVYGSLAGLFVVVVFLIAVKVRTDYWSPSQVDVVLTTKHGYTPGYSRLGAIGLSNVEASILSKDLRGYVRQKELIPYLALPFMFTVVLVLQQLALSSSPTRADMSWLVTFFAGFSAIFLSASSIGTEGRNFANMYVVPLRAKELLKGKAASSLVLSLGGGLMMSVIATVLFSPSIVFLFKVLFMSVLVSIQSVFVGLCFATRYSDFTVRPKPRYISTLGMMKAFLVGLLATVITSIPVFLFLESQPYLSVLISLVSFLAISLVAFRYSLKGAEALMMEMRS